MTKAAARPEWENRIAAWRASGLSSEKFARGRGFSPDSLRKWDRRLREGDTAPRFLQLVKRSPASALADVAPKATAAARATAPARGLVIEVGGARIHVDSAVDDALLRRAVRALRSER
jgi:hypothetical protein